MAAYTLNELAVSIGALALTVFVYRRTGSAIAAAGYFLAAQFGPSLVAPLVVARIDHRPARAVLSVLYAGEAVLFLGLAALVAHFSLAGVLTLALLDGILALTARSVARTASVDVLSPAGLLAPGNALTNTAFSICFFAGPAIGGLGAAAGGTRTMLLIVAAGFGAITFVIASKSGLPSPSAERGGLRLRAALGQARGEAMLLRLLVLEGLALMIFSIAVPVEIVLARRSLHVGASGYGALLASWGLGAVIGSGVYARWHALSGRVLIAGSTVAIGIGTLVIAAAPGLAVALVGGVIAGVGNGVEAVSLRTAFQERIPERLVGVMTGLGEAVSQAAPGVGILLGGGVTALAGPRPAMAVAGAGALGLAGGAWAAISR
ncbi:MAG: MFS transporter [Solirubrobacteraceae bacterium]